MIMSKHKGFTLIELMIVVTIIGILATIAVALYSNYSSRIRAVATMVELNSIKEAIRECGHIEGRFNNCAAGSNGIPTLASIPVTRNIVRMTSINQGIIEGISGATDTAGNNLIFKIIPQNTGSNVRFVVQGTICNPLRGLKVAEGC